MDLYVCLMNIINKKQLFMFQFTLYICKNNRQMLSCFVEKLLGNKISISQIFILIKCKNHHSPFETASAHLIFLYCIQPHHIYIQIQVMGCYISEEPESNPPHETLKRNTNEEVIRPENKKYFSNSRRFSLRRKVISA